MGVASEMGGGRCPGCLDPVSAHLDKGCVDCGCGLDYSESRKKAIQEGMDDTVFVTDRHDPSISRGEVKNG